MIPGGSAGFGRDDESLSLVNRPVRLLVVDDDQKVAEAVRDCLVGAGYQADVALTGGDALMLIEADRPDAVVLDILMPGMDGVDVLRRLRAADPTLPVVMLTGNGDVEVARMTLGLGAFGYVPKPFNLAQLCRVVEAAVVSGTSAP